MMKMTVEEQAELKIKKVRAWAGGDTKTVAMAHMIQPLPLIQTRAVGTMATDGVSVFYNPEFTVYLRDAQVLWVLMHEALHISYLHNLRIEGMNLEIANIAADYVINGELMRAGIGEAPEGALYHPIHSESGRSFEFVYKALMDELPDIDELIEDYEFVEEPDGEGEGESEGDYEGEDEGEETETGGYSRDGEDEDGDEEGGGASKKPPGGENNSDEDSPENSDDEEDGGPSSNGDDDGDGKESGSGKGDSPRPEEMGKFSGAGEIWPAPPDMDVSEAEKEVVDRLAEAALLEQACGAGAGGMCQNILNGHHKVEPWGFLRDYLKNAYSPETTWKRPNRRHLHRGLYLPGKDDQGKVLHFAIDSSSSVLSSMTKTYLSNVQAIADEVGINTIKIAYIDSRVHRDESGDPWQEIDVRGGDEIMFKHSGGGGTSFDPIFHEIEDSGEQVECLIYMTDGYGSVRVSDPEFPVVWLTSGTTPWGHSFGEIVDISDDFSMGW